MAHALKILRFELVIGLALGEKNTVFPFAEHRVLPEHRDVCFENSSAWAIGFEAQNRRCANRMQGVLTEKCKCQKNGIRSISILRDAEWSSCFVAPLGVCDRSDCAKCIQTSRAGKCFAHAFKRKPGASE